MDALIVVDMQPDFMEGGALPVEGGAALVEPIRAYARECHEAGRLVVATQDWHPAGHKSFASAHGRKPFETTTLHDEPQVLWPDHCVQGSIGAMVDPSIARWASMIIRKGMNPEIDSYSAFRENPGPEGHREVTGLGAFLRARRIDRVFVCGLAADYCVRWTAEDAAGDGFRSVILRDLTRAVDPKKFDLSWDGRSEWNGTILALDRKSVAVANSVED
jgi:nicotinamidase/pyrazinamidase